MCKNGTIRGGRCDVKQPHERRFKYLPRHDKCLPDLTIWRCRRYGL